MNFRPYRGSRSGCNSTANQCLECWYAGRTHKEVHEEQEKWGSEFLCIPRLHRVFPSCTSCPPCGLSYRLLFRRKSIEPCIELSLSLGTRFQHARAKFVRRVRREPSMSTSSDGRNPVEALAEE